MDVYLLPRRGGEYWLYAEEPDDRPEEPAGDDVSAPRKMWALGRKGYASITRSRRRKEALLKSLGGIARVRVHYPASLAEADARRVYDAMIEQETAKHKKWMVINAAALPLSVPLSLVPGPNVLLAYLAWRTRTHYQSKKAGEKAAELRVDFIADDVLDELASVVRRRPLFGRKKRIRRLGEKLGLGRLDRMY